MLKALSCPRPASFEAENGWPSVVSWHLTVAVSGGPQRYRPLPAHRAAAVGRPLQCGVRRGPPGEPPPRGPGEPVCHASLHGHGVETWSPVLGLPCLGVSSVLRCPVLGFSVLDFPLSWACCLRGFLSWVFLVLRFPWRVERLTLRLRRGRQRERRRSGRCLPSPAAGC